MIQDIFPHQFNNRFIPNKTISENDFIFHFEGNSLLLKTIGDEIELPRRSDFSNFQQHEAAICLFSIDESSCFLIWQKPNFAPEHFTYKEISFFRTFQKQELAWVSIVAFHLVNWYTLNKFCGKCGSPTKHKEDERALVCPSCKAMFFPKISPAIIVAIVCKDKILLARNVNFPAQWHSLIAGYTDVGETLEETVIREVKEEVGLDVKNIRYYKSQPWPLSGSMMIGFIAEADDTQAIVIDKKEIAEAAWFSRGNLPAHPSNISIAGEILDKFEKGEL